MVAGKTKNRQTMYKDYLGILWQNFFGVPYQHNGIIGEFIIETKEEPADGYGKNAMTMYTTITFDGTKIYEARITEGNLATADYRHKDHIKEKLAYMILKMIIKDGV